jgi:UDP-N-acetylmuramoyl-tripeptide--D-alanyl-D-alanine ligase
MFKVNELLEAAQARLLQGRKDTAVSGISTDSRTIRPKEAFIAIKGVTFDGHDFIDEAIKKGAGSVIIQAAGIKLQIPKDVSVIKVKDTTRSLGDIARFQRKRFDIPVVAITGSNGKTTTKEMIAHVLSRRFKVLKNEGTKNNQIGLPLTLLNLNSHHDIVVLELGTNHPGEIGYLANICLANIGIITNIGPSHLEYLHNLKGVLKEKYALIGNLEKPYIAILNKDDSLLKAKIIQKTKKPFILSLGIKNKSDFFVSDIKSSFYPAKWTSPKLHFLVNLKHKFTLKTLAYYNIYNALAAITVARTFGMEYKEIAARLADFDFPQMRFDFVEFNKIRFIDDTYNSNPLSLKGALDILNNLKTKGRKIFIMGDMLELGEHKELFHGQAGRRVSGICDIFITVGKLSNLAAKTARSCGLDIKNIFTCESAQEAGEILFNKVLPKKEDIILVKGSRLMKMEEILRS